MDGMIKEKDRDSIDHRKDNQHTYEFMIQIMNDNSQPGENTFGIKCVANEEKGQEL